MTKQEEIRVEAEDVLIGEGFQVARARFIIGELFAKLHSQGVVIKVDSAKPPIVFGKEITADSKQLAMIVEKVRDTYDRAGYVAVEPLIEE